MINPTSKRAREIINSINRKIGIEKRHGFGGIDIEMEDYIDTDCEKCIEMVVKEIVPYYRNKYGEDKAYFAGHTDTLKPGYKLLYNLNNAYVGYWLDINFKV